jgi:thiamine biosynthesis lipoprotein
MRKNLFSLFCIVILAAFFSDGCKKRPPTRVDFALGTLCTINLYDQGNVRVFNEIFDRLREIEDRMSVNLPKSDLVEVNSNAGIRPVQVHPDVYEVVELALHYAELSDGAFDPTVGPLVNLWGIGGDNVRVPAQEEIDAVLPLINWRDVELDPKKTSIYLKKPGMALDLGAIAKGYAADAAAVICKKNRIKQAIIDLGGNILTYGQKKDKSPWRVGIQNPLDSRGAYIGVVETGSQTVVTSGVYERFFEEYGVHYHHLLSPEDGYPVQNGLLSVSIVADRSADADGLSTSVFILGYEKGKALLESLGICGIFVFEDKSIRLCGDARFSLIDEDYRLADE